jgi:hypothetical protein
LAEDFDAMHAWHVGHLRYQIERRNDKHEIEMDYMRHENADLLRRLADLERVIQFGIRCNDAKQWRKWIIEQSEKRKQDV